MNSTIAKLNDEFEKMEKTIAFQKKMLDVVKPWLDSVYGVGMESCPCPGPCKLEDCTWGEIDMYSTHGLADKVFKIGDTKKVPVGRRFLPDSSYHRFQSRLYRRRFFGSYHF